MSGPHTVVLGPAATGDGWTEHNMLTWSDTRQFVNPSEDLAGELDRTIVVQTAVCHDPDTGITRIGLARYYITCRNSDDPILSAHRIEITYQTVPTPCPSEVEAVRVLAAFDPATLYWEHGQEPPSPGDTQDHWIALHWPEDIITRHHAND